MEIKINREIRDYHESMFMGLSLRQSIFSVLAIASAVGLYFWLQPILGAEITSWVCVLGAAPFAALGFVSYHGMPAEKFLWVWFRSEILEPKQLCFKPNNLYYELMKDSIAKHEKEVKKSMKAIKQVLRQDKEPYRIPKRVQDVIPIKRIWSDGIFLAGTRYCKSFKFTDINYMVASEAEQKKMFLSYAALVNSLDCGATTKITINNRHLNRKNFEDAVLMKMEYDGLDLFRDEYNTVIMDKATAGNGIIQEKYVTVSVCKKSIAEARAYFTRVGAELSAKFAALGAKATELDATERLRILHDFYRSGEEVYFRFDMQDMMKKGHDFRDYICPDSLEKHSDYLMLGGKYARVIYLKDYAAFISDQFVNKLTDQSRSMMLSIDIVPVATDEAVREVERKMLGVETNITNWQRRQNANNNFSAMVPYDMEQQRRETKEYMNDLTGRDQRMMLAVLTMIHLADTKEQLDADTEALLKVGADHVCQMAVMRYQQLDGMNTALPIGTRKIDTFRTMTTESLAAFMPFKVQEIQEPGGIYIGENAVSHNLILCNMDNLMNQSMMLLGIPGSGKSFFAKLLIIAIALSTKDDIVILDPEGEYSPLVKALGGSVIRFAVGGTDWLNAMDMENGYGEGSPVAFKSQFIMSLLKQVDPEGIGPHQKSIIDRCVAQVCKEKKQTNIVATLCTVREKLLEQPEPEAQDIALTMELYTSGSLDIFAHETNVDTKNRIISYDIHDLSEDLKQPGFVTITDAMLNRVNFNWAQGKKTHVIVDEFHIAYENEYSGNFFTSAWRQFRKRNASPVAITQNVDYLLDAPQARSMLSNSEFIVMLNQAEKDQERLSQLLNISPEQMRYVNGSEAGSGLLRYGNALVPFINKFPMDTELYRLITTRPGEGVFAKGQVDFDA